MFLPNKNDVVRFDRTYSLGLVGVQCLDVGRSVHSHWLELAQDLLGLLDDVLVLWNYEAAKKRSAVFM